MNRFHTIMPFAIIGILLLSVAGCPAPPADESEFAQVDAPGQQSADDQAEPASVDEDDATVNVTLAEVAVWTAETDPDYGMAVSESGPSDAIVIGSSGGLPQGVYWPGYNPYGPDDGDQASGGGSGGDEDGAGGSDDGADKGNDGGGAGAGDPTGSGTFRGKLACAYYEELEGYGALDDTFDYVASVTVDSEGRPLAVPVPMFVTRNLYELTQIQPGQTDVHTEQFASDTAFTVTITVVSADYSPGSLDLTLAIDTRWVGEHSSIIFSGTHTVHADWSSGPMVWNSHTRYEGEFRAKITGADDWHANGIQSFDLSGSLRRQ